MERRNPYLILGIPFGSTRDQANRAYARKRRDAKSADRSVQTDLTWALQQIDEGPKPPESALMPYRIPADPRSAWDEGVGVFSPPFEVPRFTEEAGEAGVKALQASAAHEYLQQLVEQRSRLIPPPAP